MYLYSGLTVERESNFQLVIVYCVCIFVGKNIRRLTEIQEGGRYSSSTNAAPGGVCVS